MGLNIYTASGASVRVGSYSYVHIVRAMVAWLVYEAMRAQGDDEAERALAYVPYRIKRDETPRAVALQLDEIQGKATDYNGVPEYEPSLNQVLQGLCLFVRHSDCDGEHEPEEVMEIAMMFAFITPVNREHLAKHIYQDDLADSAKHIERIAGFFNAALTANDTVRYG